VGVNPYDARVGALADERRQRAYGDRVVASQYKSEVIMSAIVLVHGVADHLAESPDLTAVLGVDARLSRSLRMRKLRVIYHSPTTKEIERNVMGWGNINFLI
jgi:hypothetical protein